MQFTAHEEAKLAVLLDAAANAASATKSLVLDTLGWREALIKLQAEVFAAATGATRTLTVEEGAAEAGPFAAVVGAVVPALSRDDNSVVAAAAVSAGPEVFTLAGNPNQASRLILTLTDVGDSITSITVRVTGTIKRPDGVSVEQVEDIPLNVGASPNITRSKKAFLTVTKVETPVAVVGVSGGETLDVGHDNSGLDQPRFGRLNLINRSRYVRLSYDGGAPSGTTRVVGSVVLLHPREKPALQVVGAADFNLEF